MANAKIKLPDSPCSRAFYAYLDEGCIPPPTASSQLVAWEFFRQGWVAAGEAVVAAIKEAK